MLDVLRNFLKKNYATNQLLKYMHSILVEPFVHQSPTYLISASYHTYPGFFFTNKKNHSHLILEQNTKSLGNFI